MESMQQTKKSITSDKNYKPENSNLIKCITFLRY